MTASGIIEISNQRGLHARASAAFSRLAQTFSAEIKVSRGGMDADGKSIMELLSLGASKGYDIEITAAGADAQEALSSLTKLVEDKFGEEV
jgi:phosphocarrier protein